MAKWLALLCSCLALGLVAGGCGSDDEGDGGGGAETKQAEPAEEPAAEGGGAKTAAVSMKDISFQPAEVTVAKGGKVTWTNDDSARHDVTKTGGPGAEFKSGEPGEMAKGDTFEQAFDTPGTVEYVCTVHPGMKGTVAVE